MLGTGDKQKSHFINEYPPTRTGWWGCGQSCSPVCHVQLRVVLHAVTSSLRMRCIHCVIAHYFVQSNIIGLETYLNLHAVSKSPISWTKELHVREDFRFGVSACRWYTKRGQVGGEGGGVSTGKMAWFSLMESKYSVIWVTDAHMLHRVWFNLSLPEGVLEHAWARGGQTRH